MWRLWELRARQPARCYGVTGTNGKSSTVYFLHQIWTHHELPNYTQAGFGTHTWPDLGIGPVAKKGYKPLKKKLHELHKHGIQRCCLECYSYNLQWGLLDVVKFSGAAFLNLTQEHLENYPTVEHYFAAKKRLFTDLIADDAPTVIGGDCPYGRRLIEVRKNPLVFGSDPSYPLHFDELFLHVFDERFPIRDLGFPPVDIYLLNLLCAVGLATIDGCSPSDIVSALPSLRLPPGRIEKIATLSGNRRVYSDYAHNADGIGRTLKYLKSMSDGRRICVMSWKPRREDFCAIHRTLNQGAYLTIITSDVDYNPRLSAIHSDLENVLVIKNRREAIATAIALSLPGDTIMASGGHRRFFDEVTGRELTDMELIRDLVAGLQP